MEAQNTKFLNEEELVVSQQTVIKTRNRKTLILTITNFVLLIISSLCFCLIFVPYDNRLQRSIHRAGIVYAAFLITAISSSIFIVSQFLKRETPKLIINTYSAVFGILLFIAGYFIISDWRMLMHSLYYHPPKMFMDLMICSGVFAIFGSIISFAYIYITEKYL